MKKGREMSVVGKGDEWRRKLVKRKGGRIGEIKGETRSQRSERKEKER